MAMNSLSLSYSIVGVIRDLMAKFKYCCQAPTTGDMTESAAELTFTPVSPGGDGRAGATPANTQLWPALVAGFGLPRGLTITFGGDFGLFRHGGAFYYPEGDGTSEARHFCADVPLRIYGLDHKLVVTMQYATADCGVSGVSVVLYVSATRSAASQAELEAIGLLEATDVTIEDEPGPTDVFLSPPSNGFERTTPGRGRGGSGGGGDENDEDDASSAGSGRGSDSDGEHGGIGRRGVGALSPGQRRKQKRRTAHSPNSKGPVTNNAVFDGAGPPPETAAIGKGAHDPPPVPVPMPVQVQAQCLDGDAVVHVHDDDGIDALAVEA